MIKLIFICFLSIPTLLFSAPMGFKDSVTPMSGISKGYSFIETNYAYDAKSAIGVKLFHMDNNNRIRDGIEINHIHRLFRQNKKHSQMNGWLFGGIGYLEGSNEAINDKELSATFVSPGLQWDYETKRVYALASHQLIRGDSINHDTTKLKAGFSFYETGYNQTQPWFILEMTNINGISPQLEITPTIRLINKSLFLEGGISNMGNPKIHVMYTF